MNSARQSKIRDWLVDAALPLWSTRGLDEQGGGFVERLTPSGEPDYAAPKRIRVQARQIYVFARAAADGLWPKGLEVAQHGFKFLAQRVPKAGRRGFPHIVDRAGRVLDVRRDTYDHAFLLLAFAWLFRATGSAESLAAIEQVRDAIDNDLRHPSGSGYVESDRAELPRRQNPHMHLFEAYLATYDATKDTTYMQRAKEILALFEDHFFQRETQTLREFFTDDWQAAAGEAGRIVEPGHHFEWAWLLAVFARASNAVVPPAARSLCEFARRYGRDPASQLIYDEVWTDGGAKRTTKRTWPLTEAIKAELALGAIDAKSPAETGVERDMDLLFEHYLDKPIAGAWVDSIDGANASIPSPVPASTLYHIFCAFSECLGPAHAEKRPQFE